MPTHAPRTEGPPRRDDPSTWRRFARNTVARHRRNRPGAKQRSGDDRLWRDILQGVGRFTRTAALVPILVLAGGPAVATMCEAVCLAPPATVDATGPGATPHHHQQHAPGAHQQGAAEHVDGTHAHHRTDPTTAAAGDSHPSRFLGQDCCGPLARSRAALAASRFDTDLVPRSHAALDSTAAVLSLADRHQLEPAHGPPPKGPSPIRAPLVLRI